jgi:hypothetical protein
VAQGEGPEFKPQYCKKKIIIYIWKALQKESYAYIDIKIIFFSYYSCKSTKRTTSVPPRFNDSLGPSQWNVLKQIHKEKRCMRQSPGKTTSKLPGVLSQWSYMGHSFPQQWLVTTRVRCCQTAKFIRECSRFGGWSHRWRYLVQTRFQIHRMKADV